MDGQDGRGVDKVIDPFGRANDFAVQLLSAPFPKKYRSRFENVSGVDVYWSQLGNTVPPDSHEIAIVGVN